jgi:hypothetical protein
MQPQPDLMPRISDDTPVEMRLKIWLDLLDASEQFLLAGLRREIGPDGDLIAAYRKWYKEQMEEHDKMMYHMMEEFSKRGGGHGGHGG